MVKKFSELYLDVRKALMEKEEEQYASMLARELICYISGKSHQQFLMDRESYATEQQCCALNDAVRRLLNDEPLAYILGEWTFYGLNLYVNEHVLIPRDDTCALAELAMDRRFFSERAPRILDLCTGSGCIGLAIASKLPGAHVTLGDISPDALAVAKKNISRLKLGGRVCALQMDATEKAPQFLGKFHMIVSNPPYITTEEMKQLPKSVADFEPHLALHGGDDGLLFYRAIVENFTAALQPGGYMAFEYGEGQGDAVCGILENRGYTILERVRDFNETERACLARYDRKEE